MKILPEKICINRQKISDYLLNVNHPDGGTKAKLLISLGFDINNASVLENMITKHATGNDVSKVIATPFGEKFLVEGIIETPSGKFLQIRSVWVKESKEELLKFVTLYPNLTWNFSKGFFYWIIWPAPNL